MPASPTRLLRSEFCQAAEFDAYVKARATVDAYMRKFYESAFLRNQKYSTYLAKKASEDRLVDRLRNKFGGTTDQPKAIVLAWGNWGAFPNALKGCGPSPGIGLCRRIHARLQRDRRSRTVELRGGTLTVFEGMTSSVCNACGGSVSEARDRSGRTSRRVLRCSACCKCWQRDELGSLNILACARSLLACGQRPDWLTHR